MYVFLSNHHIICIIHYICLFIQHHTIAGYADHPVQHDGLRRLQPRHPASRARPRPHHHHAFQAGRPVHLPHLAHGHTLPPAAREATRLFPRGLRPLGLHDDALVGRGPHGDVDPGD